MMLPPTNAQSVRELSLSVLFENPENSDYAGQHGGYANAILLARLYEFCAVENITENIAFLMSIHEWLLLEPGSREELQKLSELYHYFISTDRPESVLIPFFNKKLPNVNLPDEILVDFPKSPQYDPSLSNPPAYSKQEDLPLIREKITQAKRLIETNMRIEIQIRFINSIIAIPSSSVSSYTTNLIETYKNNLIDMKKAKRSWESKKILKSNLIKNILDDVISVSDDYFDKVLKPKPLAIPDSATTASSSPQPQKSFKGFFTQPVTSLFWFKVKRSETNKQLESSESYNLEESVLSELQEILKIFKSKLDLESLPPDDTAKKLIHEIKKAMTKVPQEKRSHRVWQHLQDNLDTLENFSLLGKNPIAQKREI